MVEFFIAVRHILERKFQSIFSILGVAIAVTVFIVSLTVSNGLEKNMITSLLTLSPHIQIKSSKGSFFENYDNVIEKTKGIKDVKAVIPQINSQSIIKFDNYAKGVLAKGMKAENVENDLKLRIVKGNSNISELNSILIGEGLSKEMKLKVGDELSLVSAENKELKLIVRGIFKTGFLRRNLAATRLSPIEPNCFPSDVAILICFSTDPIMANLSSGFPSFCNRMLFGTSVLRKEVSLAFGSKEPEKLTLATK